MDKKQLNTMKKETLAVAVKNLLTGDKNLFGKNLFDRMEYTYKAFEKSPKSVTKKDFIDLIIEAENLVKPKKAVAEEPAKEENTSAPADESDESPKTENVVPLTKKGKPVENSVKKEDSAEGKKKLSSKKTVNTESSEEESKPNKKAVVKNSLRANDKQAVEFTALMDFPQTFEEDGVTYELAEGIETIQDIQKAVADNETLVFCFHWNKTQLKQGNYAVGLDKPKSFPNDLDISGILYVSDNFKVVYAISLTSECIYGVTPTALEEVDGRRFSDGVDYQIYRIVE